MDKLVKMFTVEQNALLTAVFLLREFQGQRSLVGYSSWTRKESATTK